MPLSLLDHNLVAGNSLVGIGRIDEIAAKASEDHDFPLVAFDAHKLVGEALEPLQRLARIADTTVAEVRQARKAMAQARAAVRPAEALCDVVTACRMTEQPLPVDLDEWDQIKNKIVGSKEHAAALEQFAHLPPFHFPIAFPEVFLRERNGFDVILGNPPWEKARVEEHGFWARRHPGIRSLPQREYERVRADLRKNRPDLVESSTRKSPKPPRSAPPFSTAPIPAWEPAIPISTKRSRGGSGRSSATAAAGSVSFCRAPPWRQRARPSSGSRSFAALGSRPRSPRSEFDPVREARPGNMRY